MRSRLNEGYEAPITGREDWWRSTIKVSFSNQKYNDKT